MLVDPYLRYLSKPNSVDFVLPLSSHLRVLLPSALYKRRGQRVVWLWGTWSRVSYRSALRRASPVYPTDQGTDQPCQLMYSTSCSSDYIWGPCTRFCSFLGPITELCEAKQLTQMCMSKSAYVCRLCTCVYIYSCVGLFREECALWTHRTNRQALRDAAPRNQSIRVRSQSEFSSWRFIATSANICEGHEIYEYQGLRASLIRLQTTCCYQKMKALSLI